jgi:hypothetical protein
LDYYNLSIGESVVHYAPFHGNQTVKLFLEEAFTKEPILGQTTHLPENCIQVGWTNQALLIYSDDVQVLYCVHLFIYGKVAIDMKVLIIFSMACMEYFIYKSLITFVYFLCSSRQVENFEI